MKGIPSIKDKGIRVLLSNRLLIRDDRVDLDEYVAILAAAVNRKNGWKSILAQCSE